MKIILLLFLTSLTLWGCGDSRKGGDFLESDALTVKYDSLYKDDDLDMLVRNYTPLDSTLLDLLPNGIPEIVTNGVAKSEKLFNRLDCEYTGDYYYRDRCVATKQYTFDVPEDYEDRRPETWISIEVHNNSESMSKLSYIGEFRNPEEVKNYPDYKGFKYVFDHMDCEGKSCGSDLSIFLPPFVKIRLKTSIRDSTMIRDGKTVNGVASSRYLSSNWKKILDEMDLEKINKKFNSNPIHYVK